ncbi:hypothetical protein [Rhizobium rhizogenes]|uniref:hypothetical protein n=1 Tax=Rhizobium rhizogenes TaxID=359 RepID=UPI00193E8C74|nr:hypothetical protein [Rhizobium rhizogenes]
MTNKLEQKTAELEKATTEKKAAEDKNSSLDAQVKELTSRVANLRQEISDNSAAADKRLKEVQSELFESQKANIFVSGSPYPVGFDKVKLGDPVSKITEAYPYENQSKNSTHSAFKVPSDIFDWLSFDYAIEKKDVVEAVSLDTGTFRALGKNPKPPLPDHWLETSLMRALGKPLIEMGPDKQCTVWRINNMDRTLVFYLKGATDYTISKGIAPGGCYFTKEQEKELDIKK